MLDIDILTPMRTTRLGLGTITILQALEGDRRFGFDIMDATGLTSGTVYPALERLEELGFVRSKWENETTAHRDGRPARRYFEITAAGGKALAEALARYPLMRSAARNPSR
jgi:PadR family transcriptional regulator PadR